MRLGLLACAVSSCLWMCVWGEENCETLEFEDPMLGTLIPCVHPKAQGMLCVKDLPEVVVWPEKKESDRLSGCNITREDQQSSKRRRKRSTFTCRSFEECKRKRRKKRQNSASVELIDHLSQGYNYKKMLEDLVRMEYGKEGEIEIDPAAQLFINTKIRLEQNNQQGIYRALVGPASQFDPDSTNGARDTILKLLRGKKKKENWDWLDVDRMGRELEMCFHSDYSAVTAQDVLFKTPKENIQLEMGTNKSRSTFGYWYFKVVCMRDEDRIFLTTVVYTDQMRLADIEKTVQFWRNNPETVTKYIKGSRQRLVKSIRSQTVHDTTTKTGQSCYTKKKGWWRRKRKKRICNSWTNTQQKARSINLMKQQILTDVTTKQFLFEVNNWVKDTKQVMERRTLSLRERENLKDWLHNTVLTEIMHHFSNFFKDDIQVDSQEDSGWEDITSWEDLASDE